MSDVNDAMRDVTADANRISGRCRVKRALLRLSLREAAEQAEVSAATFSRVERGENYDVATLMRLCAWLGCSPNEALGWGNHSPAAGVETLPLPEAPSEEAQ